jgi:hypothetical protein
MKSIFSNEAPRRKRLGILPKLSRVASLFGIIRPASSSSLCFCSLGLIKYFVLAIIFLLPAFSSPCFAETLKESGLKITPVVKDEKVTEIKVTVRAANGGPTINSLKVDQAESTTLMATVSLTAKSGLYKVELLDHGKPTLVLTAKGGQTLSGAGSVSVNEEGSMQYRVLARKAKNVVFDIVFSRPPAAKEDDRISRLYFSGKSSPDGDGLNLILTCLSGKNCNLRVQNLSLSKACRNIAFQIDYNVMTAEGVVEKSKRGMIAEPLFPNKSGEWPIGLIFGELPKDIKILLINAEGVDPAEIKLSDVEQRQNTSRPPITLETLKKSD